MPLGENVIHSLTVKRCAQHIVKESFIDILIGEFQVPSQGQMERFLFENTNYGFDEYQVAKKIQSSRPQWNEERIRDELEKQNGGMKKNFVII